MTDTKELKRNGWFLYC